MSFKCQMAGLAGGLPSCIRQQPQRGTAQQVTLTLNNDDVQHSNGAEPEASSSSSIGSPVAPVVGTEVEEGSARRRSARRRRRCAATQAITVVDEQARQQAAALESDEEESMPAQRRTTCAPVAVTRWADRNACSALTALVLDNRRRSKLGLYDSTAAMGLCTELIAPFLRFDAPLPNMLYVIGGRSQGYNALDKVEMFDTWHGHWVPCPPLPSPRVSATAATLPDERILVVGGYDGRGMVEGLLASCEVFDPHKQQWEKDAAAPMHRARWGHGCAALGGRVYVVGGCSLTPGARPVVTSMETLRSCEVYSPEHDRWNATASLQTPRSGSRAVAVAGRYLAAVGGCDDIFGREEHLSTVEFLDPAMGRWVLLPRQLRCPRPIAGVAAFNAGHGKGSGQVLIVGGAAALTSAEVYCLTLPKAADVSREQYLQDELETRVKWRQVPDVPEGRMGCQAATIVLPRLGGPTYPSTGQLCAVLIGGEVWESIGPDGVPKRVEFSSVPVFDVSARIWRDDCTVPPMSGPRTAVAVCVGAGFPSTRT